MSCLPIQYIPQFTPDIPTYGEPAPRPLLPCAECMKRVAELELKLKRLLWVLAAEEEGSIRRSRGRSRRNVRRHAAATSET